ncbi:hypothetical protein [Lactiplantibacillus modestisalitolerans]|uniref:Uncharacterized protein n=1 Tax=Lactiplantibacillus modestisalitolerans TaxID=1457219 RepID=A0ABV5WT27_9LACO|nr:hypothetical protein [Lactiplantibacillus modestisalitolerans]
MQISPVVLVSKDIVFVPIGVLYRQQRVSPVGGNTAGIDLRLVLTHVLVIVV